VESTNQPYLFPEFQRSQSLVGVVPRRVERELSTGRILLHAFLLALTAVTTVITGAAWSLQSQGGADSLLEALIGPHILLLKTIADGQFVPLANGLLFAFTLLVILGAHELGHYFACRYYGIRATLPFFIPAPPAPITPFGTFGAVIKIKSPITSRRALFDIGIAGPLAGFLFALPAAVVGLLFAKPAHPPAGEGIQFNDPLLFIVIMKVFGVAKWIEWNPVYWAAWAAVLVTALNLFPVGQLDGGHVLYAVAGPRLHKLISRAVTAAVALLAVASFYFYGSPIWVLWTVVLFFLMRVGHPPTRENEPLGAARIALAVIAALVFLFCFMPFPVTLS
jgi:membrane-associated protease RseP (regulator of RpoE activity)